MASSANTSATRSGRWASMPAFHRSRISRKTSVSSTLTTVYMQYLAGDERSALEIHHRVDDVVDRAHPAQRMHLRQGIVGRRIMHRGPDDAKRNGVGSNSPARVLDRELLGDRVEPAL